jgi:outer membrane protein assembly factor BamB
MSMKVYVVVVCSVLVSLAAALVALDWWLDLTPVHTASLSVPGMDDPDGRKAEDALQRKEQIFKYGEIFKSFKPKPARTSGRWPRFRGPNMDGISPQDTVLAETFPSEGPRQLWSLELGPGYGGVAIFDGYMYVMDYLERQGDALRCFELDTAEEVWRCGYRIKVPNNHGITRTTPAVTESYIVTMGPMGQVMCVDRPTGKVRWGMSLSREYGTRDLSGCWYAGQCPLIDDGKAIIAPAGTNVMMIAVSCDTGEVLWKAPNRNGWRMSHSSIVPVTVEGTKMYVYCSIGGVTAVGAEGELAGKVLWETGEWSSSVVMPSPVVLEGNRLFLTSGYDGGSALLKVVKEGDTFKPEIVYNYTGKRKARDCFSTYQHTPIYYKEHLFGIQLNSARKSKLEFVCVDPAEPGGRIVWGSGADTVFSAPKKREAWGPYILADGKFYVIGDTGLLAMFEANTKECRKLGEWQLLEDGHEVWGPVAIVDGCLFLRDYTRLVCFDLRQDQSAKVAGDE